MSNSSSSPSWSSFPTFGRFFRWLFNWRTLGRAIVGLAVLATLVALVCAEETWRGKRAWERYKHELEAKGEKLDWRDYIPPPVPEDQNFAMTPFLAPIFDFNPEPRQEGQSIWRDTNGYNRVAALGEAVPDPESILSERNAYRTLQRMTDFQGWALSLKEKAKKGSSAAAPALTRSEAAAELLRAMEKLNPVLEELRSASRRPYARFNIHYEGVFAQNILLPHLSAVSTAGRIFQSRASAELALGRSDEAWADTQMALYLADTLKTEPFLISRIVQVTMVQRSLQPIWEGLAEHKWSDAQLMEMEQRLAKLDLPPDAAMRAERAWNLLTVDQLRHMGSLDPRDASPGTGPAGFLLGGFYYQNQLFIARMYQQFIVPVVDAANHRLYPSRVVANDAALANAIASGFRPYHLFAQTLLLQAYRTLPGISSTVTEYGFVQTRVNEAIVACALERYRLAEGQFPESLEPLCPRFLDKMPHDIITGAPLTYRRTPDGQFILYSVGWNEKDDGGMIVMTEAERPDSDLTQGDWVWQYPAPARRTASQ